MKKKKTRPVQRAPGVQALAKGFALLRSFNRDTPSMTLSEAAEATRLPRATARRLLHTLIQLGYVEADKKQFRLTPNVLGLGYSYLSSLPWWDIALPYMRAASAALHETCVAAVLSGHDVVLVARTRGTRFISVNIPIGERIPAHVTAMGRLLLAHLPDDGLDAYLADAQLQKLTPRTVTNKTELRKVILTARKQGFSCVDQELEIGLRTIATPIVDSSGQIIAAIAVSVHVSRATVRDLRAKILPVLRETAASISAALPPVGGS